MSRADDLQDAWEGMPKEPDRTRRLTLIAKQTAAMPDLLAVVRAAQRLRGEEDRDTRAYGHQLLPGESALYVALGSLEETLAAFEAAESGLTKDVAVSAAAAPENQP